MSVVMEIRKKLMDLDDQANELWFAFKAHRITSQEFAKQIRPLNDKRYDLVDELAKLTEGGHNPFGN
jgi:hypothetical protein